MVNLTINGKAISAEPGQSVLEAALAHHVVIPHLCFLEGVHQAGACRVCVVEVEGARTLQASCVVEVREGMQIRTNTERVKRARRMLFELMLSDHPRDCLACARNQNCEFQRLAELIQITEDRFHGEQSHPFHDGSSPSIFRETSKCILCRRCVTVCNEIQGVGALNVQNRGFKSVVGPPQNLPLGTSNCVGCGQCTTVCPVGALVEQDATAPVAAALCDPKKRVMVQTAPAIRAAIGEEFGLPPGTLVTGKLAAALHEMGFDDVFDTNVAADLTIIEEGTEFLGRAKAVLTGSPQKPLPMLTSCSPGWIKYVEHEYPQLLPHLSTCKSPHMMLGALAKTYYAERTETRPEDMYVVSVMPCTAKKFEITRPEMFVGGRPAVDAVLTTRELARMIRESGIEFASLPDQRFDDPLGVSTGAADIFAASGGVMEAALRTVYEIVTGRNVPFPNLEVAPVRGLIQVKEAAFTFTGVRDDFKFLEGFTARVAVTSGLTGAKKLLEQIVRGESPYHFIEVMGCPGGCISGGGQPRPTNRKVREARMAAIYAEDTSKRLRKSHESPVVRALYETYLGEPNGHRAHELLHTHYVPRGRYNQLVKP